MFNPLLTSFVCVADSGSFNQAAEKLYISSTAVIKQINSLEKHLDLKLFERTNHGIRLTAAGQVIYRYAKQMFTLSEQAITQARMSTEIANRTFCVGTSILNPCRPFMDLWYQVNSFFPGYQLHIVPFEDDHADILTQISALGVKFDFLIGACDSRQWLTRCRFLPLCRCPQSIAVPREHPLAGKKKLRLRDLYGETVMLVKRGDSPTVDRLRDDLERYPQIHLVDTPQFYDIEVFNRCVQTGCLLVTLDCWAEVHPSLVTIPVEWDHAIPYGILYQLDPPEDVARFIEMVRTRARFPAPGSTGQKTSCTSSI